MRAAFPNALPRRAARCTPASSLTTWKTWSGMKAPIASCRDATGRAPIASVLTRLTMRLIGQSTPCSAHQLARKERRLMPTMSPRATITSRSTRSSTPSAASSLLAPRLDFSRDVEAISTTL